jgi:drug/metabolite transporter (DMT)-like permease
MWLTISLANMLFLVGLRLTQKKFVASSTMNAFRINWLTFAMSLPIIIGIIVTHLQPIAHLSSSFWLALIVVVVGYYPLVNYLYFHTIRQNELSSILPLLGLIPVLTALFSWLLLQQTPSWPAVIGIVSISASIYALYQRAGNVWYEPLVALGSSTAARAMGVVSLITAVAAVGDKFAIERSSTSLYLALNTVGALLVLGFCDVMTVRRQDSRTFWREMGRLSNSQWRVLISLGVLWFMAQILGFVAINISPNVAYVQAITSLDIVVASVAAVLLFHERFNRHKLFCYGLSAFGVVMIAL